MSGARPCGEQTTNSPECSGALPQKVLVANFGTSASSLLLACKRLGVPCVAVYSLDMPSPHALEADEAVPIPCLAGFQDGAAIIAACQQVNASAVVVGSGPLQSSADFAQLCAANDIEVIGPTERTRRRLTDRFLARQAAQQAGLQCVQGSGVLASAAEAMELCSGLGRTFELPVMLKAVSGCHGLGNTLVTDIDELEAHFDALTCRSTELFGDGRVYLETAYTSATRVEVNIFGDGRGRAVSMGTRECTVEVRSKSQILESPSSAFSRQLISELTAAAEQFGSFLFHNSVGIPSPVLLPRACAHTGTQATHHPHPHPPLAHMHLYPVRVCARAATPPLLSVRPPRCSARRVLEYATKCAHSHCRAIRLARWPVRYAT